MTAPGADGGAGGPAPDADSRLADLIERELHRPRPFVEVAKELPDLVPAQPHLGRALAALAEADRRRFWVGSQALWFSRFGWRLIRPMMGAGIVGMAAYWLAAPDEAARLFLHFLLGIAALYTVLQVYAHFWSRQDERALAEARSRLEAELRAVLEGLRR